MAGFGCPPRVTDLAQALEHPDARTEAAEAIRGLIDAIVLTPAEGTLEAHVVRRGRPARGPAEAGHYNSGLQIELKGNLAAMLSAATNARCKLKWLRGLATGGTCSCGAARHDGSCRLTG